MAQWPSRWAASEHSIRCHASGRVPRDGSSRPSVCTMTRQRRRAPGRGLNLGTYFFFGPLLIIGGLGAALLVLLPSSWTLQAPLVDDVDLVHGASLSLFRPAWRYANQAQNRQPTVWGNPIPAAQDA